LTDNCRRTAWLEQKESRRDPASCEEEGAIDTDNVIND
jgi:hypothetical protein